MKYIFHFLILLGLSFGIVAGSSAQSDNMQQLVQWASSAQASSEYDAIYYSAAQATGSPNITGCEDNYRAWQARNIEDGVLLILSYSQAVIPTQINIFQNQNPGAIVAVAVSDSSVGESILVESQRDPSNECPSIYSVNLPENLPAIDTVILVLDLTQIDARSQIDAVELVGLVEGNPDNSQQSSIERGDYPEYTLFENFNLEESPNSSEPERTVAWGLDVQCDDGTTIDKGIELQLIQQRVGNAYRITVIGISNFDPVLAVTLKGDYENAQCNNDSEIAANYSTYLPTTGEVNPSTTSAQVRFVPDSDKDFEDVSVIVGGNEGSTGQFIVIIEDMFAGASDAIGDPFSLALSPALLYSDRVPTVYMIGLDRQLNPFMFMVDGKLNPLNDSQGKPLECEDAGSEQSCWGQSSNLADYFVSPSEDRELFASNRDAMMSVPFTEEELGYYFNFIMNGNKTYGDYLVVFHLGIQSED